MAKNRSLRLTAALLLLPFLSPAAPPVIDDMELVRAFERGVGEHAGQEGIPSADELAAATKAPLEAAGDLTPATTPLARADYETVSQSVFMLGAVYKCDKCENWHAGGIATAWCVGEDGLMVSNAHVFQNTKGSAMGITDRHGKSHPVTALLAIDKAADVALFRVKPGGTKFQPLPLGADAGIGTQVRVISHPGRRYFMHTSGEVSRYHRQPQTRRRPAATWMSITADYAKGSSGGPVFNAAGEVVGMVSSTQSIYYDSDDGSPKGPLQMVIKNCVPVAAIRQLLSGK